MRRGIFKFVIGLILLNMGMTAVEAAITLSVSGGKSNTPLVINITVGDSFNATTDVTNNEIRLRFIDIFDTNGAVGSGSTAAVSTTSLGGSSTSGLTGVITSGQYTLNDLVVGFQNANVTNGNAITLTTGTRQTNFGLFLSYLDINNSGNVLVTDHLNNTISNTIAYTVVPEPKMTMIATGGALLFACTCLARHRKPQQNAV